MCLQAESPDGYVLVIQEKRALLFVGPSEQPGALCSRDGGLVNSVPGQVALSTKRSGSLHRLLWRPSAL